MIEDENTDERMRGGIYTQWNITQPKMNEIMPFSAIWMDLESVILSEVSQRRRNILLHPLNVESKKKLTNRKRLTDFKNKLMVAGGGWG